MQTANLEEKLKIFVTGVNGQLGYEVINEAAVRGFDCVGSDITEQYAGICKYCEKAEYIQLDITDSVAVDNVISQVNPDVVVHCAAWTAVDAAEDNEEKVHAVNVSGTENVAKACEKYDCKMIYISTDYVFDGKGTTPWEADCVNYAPLSVYGKSKLLGEKAVSKLQKYFIVRIAWVFGQNGNNFVKTMLSVGRKYDTVRVVNDQIGTPTYAFDLAKLLCDMAKSDKYGYYHATNEGGFISWYDFTCEIYRKAGLSTKVVPVTTQEYGLTKAARPENSRLDKSKLSRNGFSLLPDWKEALSHYLKTIKEI